MLIWNDRLFYDGSAVEVCDFLFQAGNVVEVGLYCHFTQVVEFLFRYFQVVALDEFHHVVHA